MITIGIDPHKASLTAVAVDPSGRSLGHRRLLVNAGTLGQLMAWAAVWPVRRFAVEGAYGLGAPSPSNWPPAANRSWTCRPPSGPGRQLVEGAGIDQQPMVAQRRARGADGDGGE